MKKIHNKRLTFINKVKRKQYHKEIQMIYFKITLKLNNLDKLGEPKALNAP